LTGLVSTVVVPRPDLGSLVLVLGAASLAAILAKLDRRLVVPTVVLELTLGVALGPQVLGWAHADPYIQFLADLGLAMLFFFAGLEVVERHVPRHELALGSAGWAISLTLAIGIGYLLHSAGVRAEGWLLGIALSTTSLGTLVPILDDARLLSTPLGRAALGKGVAGEFWPIIVISVFLTGVYGAATEVVLLIAFGGVVVLAATAALRARPPAIVRVLRASVDSTGQAAVRLSIALVAALVLLAEDAGFDFILGAFAAGLIAGLVFDSPEGQSVQIRLEGIGYGFVIPVYFVATGLRFDVDSLLTLRGIGYTLLFAALLLIVRGTSALLWLPALGARRTASLALFAATGLPLIVAIVSIGLERGAIGAGVGASLIGAGMLSVLMFPLIAIGLSKVQRPARRQRPLQGSQR
jgi:Kef-type K+ transport system membrane component KefB